ncbi:c-type cytochrome [bacterium]|nr:c-type cytochrome [bacterium]
MAKKREEETVYDTNNLSKWFAISSIILLIAVVWAVIEDYDREWKNYDKQSKKIVAAIGEAKLKAAEAAIDSSKLKTLETKLSELQAKEEPLVEEIDVKIKELEDDYYTKNQKFQIEKAKLDGFLFEVEVATKKLKPKSVEMKKKYDEMKLEVDKLQAVAVAAETSLNEAREDKKKIQSNTKKLSDLEFKLTKEIDLLKKTISENGPNLGNTLRNAPLVDFVTPTVKINQVVLPNLLDDYFMNKVARVDRCITCHATIDKEGFEDFPQPFRTHPKLNLISGPDSPHPVNMMGCTVCHSGVGNSVDFTLSAHTPSSQEQELEWEELYGFHRSHHIRTHMIPVDMVEGKCIQCHAKQVELTGAPTLNAGIKLVERMGCYGCHKMNDHFDRLTTEKKSGPSLERIFAKVEEEWVKKWLWDPKSFRPSTLMPAFWQLHNNSDEASLARGAVEVDSIVYYLKKRSKEYEPIKTASALTGDVEKGKALVAEVGCLACHASEDYKVSPISDPTQLGYQDPRVPNPGPELNQLGSKVTKEWLTSWLINPKHYWEGTSMPSMKLKAQEAADIAAYLLTKKNDRFERMNAPVPTDEVRDQLVMDSLLKKQSPKDAELKIASMSLEDKRDFLGEQFVGHYGCYGCHAIEGFDKAPKIGAELTYEGSKDITKFVFENVHIDHAAREEWIYTKIRTPRVWDVGKVRPFDSKTRMPQFNLTSEQARAIAAFVIGLENKNVRDEAIFKVDGRMEQVIEGHRLIHRYNCASCHAIENQNGHVLAHYQDDITLGPPNLSTQGEKVQTDWLHAYLLNTDIMIRPWLTIRMPVFQMTSNEATDLTKYFAAYDKAPYPYMNQSHKILTGSELAQAQKLYVQMGCNTCHAPRAPGQTVADAAPHLSNVKARLRSDWIVKWLRNPSAIMPGTRMPQNWPQLDPDDPHSNMAIPGYFGDDATAQLEAIRNYLMQFPGELSTPKKPVLGPAAR